MEDREDSIAEELRNGIQKTPWCEGNQGSIMRSITTAFSMVTPSSAMNGDSDRHRALIAGRCEGLDSENSLIWNN